MASLTVANKACTGWLPDVQQARHLLGGVVDRHVVTVQVPVVVEVDHRVVLVGTRVKVDICHRPKKTHTTGSIPYTPRHQSLNPKVI